MLTREFTYDDFDGKSVTETWYFHLSKPDIIKFDADYKEGLTGILTEMTKTQDKKTILEMFEKIVRLAVGKKSEDGRRFVKTEALADEFFQTPAWEQLFMDLLQGTMDGAEFIKGIMPRDLDANISNEDIQAKAAELTGTAPPTPPQVPQQPIIPSV